MTDSSLDIKFCLFPDAADISQIYTGLVDFNGVHFPDLDEKSCGVFIRDARGHIVGGLTGKIMYTTLQINYLWISDSLRARGYGKTLMEKVERESSQLGVTHICVETYNFQAPGFYKKLGFEEVGRYANYPKNGMDRIFLQKYLR